MQTATVDLSRLLAALRRRKFAIVLALVAWVILGLVYVVTTPKYYDASAMVLLDRNIDRAIQQVSPFADLATGDAAMESARLVITSDPVARRVAERLELYDDPAFIAPPSSLLGKVISYVRGTVRRPIELMTEYFSAVDDPDAGLSQTPSEDQVQTQEQARITMITTVLQQNVNVYRVGQSSAFGISYRSHDPVLAANIVNAFASVYVSDVLDANFDATERMTEWMQGRLTELETDAREAARAAEEFRAENGLVTNRNASISQDAVATINSELSTAISEAARARARVSAMQAVVDRGQDVLLSGAPSGLPSTEDEEFETRRIALANAIASFERIRTRFGEDSPQFAPSERLVEQAADRLYASIQRLLEQARGEEALAEARVSALRESLQDAVSEDVDLGPAQVQLRTLEDRAETLSTLYQTFLAQFQEVDQQGSFPISNVRLLREAQIPRSASGPSTSKTLVLCLVLGAMTGLAITTIAEWRDRFLRTSDQVNAELGVPFLGYLPRVNLPNLPKTDQSTSSKNTTVSFAVGNLSPIYAPFHMRSQYAEALRTIRLSSQLSLTSGQSCVLGITSAQPEEGKTLTSLNLAAVIAETGSSVILIDADPHRTGLTKLARLATGMGLRSPKGLLDVLTRNIRWDEVCRDIDRTRVDFIPCVVPDEFSHASEILGSAAFKALLDDLRHEYDYILLDLAPMGPVTDVRGILGELDQLVMIAEWGKTSKNLVSGLIRSTPGLEEKLLGIALNKVDLRRLSAYASETDSARYMADYDSYLSGTNPTA
ncbi:Tyrosine-protein kinase ptk [Palleronia abyssalis]|uniref:non-specific protein-tyrosine kinase n=2 Tax=Palleronia abyssalis TaxID=1501240 RepID=A0A2R8BZF6_9RHOB|nr:Tyrosine-protein kinase ptk [Palleronia abyssalis]